MAHSTGAVGARQDGNAREKRFNANDDPNLI
jgi:hypothetical protein